MDVRNLCGKGGDRRRTRVRKGGCEGKGRVTERDELQLGRKSKVEVRLKNPSGPDWWVDLVQTPTDDTKMLYKKKKKEASRRKSHTNVYVRKPTKQTLVPTK